MKTIIFSYIVFFQIFFLNAQNKTEWAEEVKKSSNENIQKTLLHNGGVFVITGSVTEQKTMFLYYYKDSKLVSRNEIKTLKNFYYSHFQNVVIINNILHVFSLTTEGKKNTVNVQLYDEKCLAIGEKINLVTFNTSSQIALWSPSNNIKIKTSKNGEYFLVEYFDSEKPKDVVSYSIYSKDFKLISQGEHKSTNSDNYEFVITSHLSDFGTYYYITKKIKKVIDEQYKETFILSQNKNNQLDQTEIILAKENHNISDIELSSDKDEIIVLTGLYNKNQKKIGDLGFYNLKIDYNSKKIIYNNLHEFKRDFLIKNWKASQIKKFDRMSSKEKYPKYKTREVIALNDGSYIGIIEQEDYKKGQSIMHNSYSPAVTPSTSATPGSTTVNSSYSTPTAPTYYYKDIYIYKINPTGEIIWLEKITKDQKKMSYLPGSYFQYTNMDKLHILFSDNVNNYDENGKWNKMNLQSGPQNHKKHRLIDITIDLVTGFQNRSIILNPCEDKKNIISELTLFDSSNNILLIIGESLFYLQNGILKL